jgi:hypothetical protein
VLIESGSPPKPVSKVRWSRSTPLQNAAIATTIRDAQADCLLAVKANQPTLCSEIESFFADAPPANLERTTDVDLAASSNEPSLSPARSTGSMTIAGFPANPVSRPQTVSSSTVSSSRLAEAVLRPHLVTRDLTGTMWPTFEMWSRIYG